MLTNGIFYSVAQASNMLSKGEEVYCACPSLNKKGIARAVWNGDFFISKNNDNLQFPNMVVGFYK